jgi:hypothetical protein
MSSYEVVFRIDYAARRPIHYRARHRRAARCSFPLASYIDGIPVDALLEERIHRFVDFAFFRAFRDPTHLANVRETVHSTRVRPRIQATLDSVT